MKKTNIFYWASTIPVCALMLFSAIPNIMADKKSIDFIATHLGYPIYIIPFLGVAKALAVIVVLLPGFARVKEWAYAGLAFDLLGAVYSLISVGEPFVSWVFLILPLTLLALSYYFYHKKIKSSAAAQATKNREAFSTM